MTDTSNKSTGSGSVRAQRLKSQATGLGERILGWLLLAPGEAVRWAQGLNRSTLAWGGLALAALLFLSVNLSASLLLRNVKADLTQDHLYTISNSTKRMLSRMEEPISVRVYYSSKLDEVSAVFSRHFRRVKELLDQYSDLSGGKLRVSYLDPEPFSDAEDRAAAAGLKGERLSQDGDTGYYGLVASNTTDNQAVIPFFATDREQFLEYDLTKLISGLANPKKKVVGLISGVQIDGGTNPMNPRAPPAQRWMIMEQIRELFEVRQLQGTEKEIPKDIDVLLVVQPTILTADAAYAVDQYALSGGRVLAFVDPVAETSPPGPMNIGSLPVATDFRKLLKAWGLSLDVDNIVADPTVARRVQFGDNGGQPIVTDYLAWLGLDRAQLNENDPLAAGIERLNLATAGVLTKVEGASTIIQPLLQTGTSSGLLPTEMVRFQPNPLALIRKFKSGGQSLMLAARIGGEAKSAFPDGRPKPKEDEKKADDAKPAEAAKSDTAKAETPKADTAATPKSDEKAKAGAETKAAVAKADEKHVAAGRVNIVVVADSDMLYDSFWVQVRDFLGQRVGVPLAHNAGFLINALENLSGGEALADLRGRGVVERPFDKVRDIRRQSELRFREKEESLNAKLRDLQTQLAKVETKGGEGGGPVTVLLSDSEKQAVEKFRGEMITVRRELRDVKAALRRDIDSLDSWLKFINIAAIPLLIGIGGLGYSLLQRRRTAPKTAGKGNRS